MPVVCRLLRVRYNWHLQVSYKCSNVGKPTAPAIRKHAVAGGGCNCDDVSLTISTGKGTELGYATVRVYGWAHNESCQRRAEAQKKLRSPDACDLLERIVRVNFGRPNPEIIVLYQKEIARPTMAKENMTFEAVSDFWSKHPDKAPRDAAISVQVTTL